MRKLVIIFIITLFTLSTVFAAHPKQYVGVYQNSISAKYSNISGYGLGISREIFDNFSVEISSFFIYNQHTRWTDMSKDIINEQTKDINYDFGIDFQYTIITTSSTRVYALIGGYYSSVDNTNLNLIINNDSKSETKIAVGIGLGFQFFMGSHVAGDAHFGYKFDKSDIIEGNIPSIDKNTNIGFGGGISYFF